MSCPRAQTCPGQVLSCPGVSCPVVSHKTPDRSKSLFLRRSYLSRLSPVPQKPGQIKITEKQSVPSCPTCPPLKGSGTTGTGESPGKTRRIFARQAWVSFGWPNKNQTIMVQGLIIIMMTFPLTPLTIIRPNTKKQHHKKTLLLLSLRFITGPSRAGCSTVSLSPVKSRGAIFFLVGIFRFSLASTI